LAAGGVVADQPKEVGDGGFKEAAGSFGIALDSWQHMEGHGFSHAVSVNIGGL
jgi:hypothetical protein